MEDMNLTSGGRSARNPTSPEARRRSSQREREGVEPPRDLIEPFEGKPSQGRGDFWAGYATGVISVGLGIAVDLLIRTIWG